MNNYRIEHTDGSDNPCVLDDAYIWTSQPGVQLLTVIGGGAGSDGYCCVTFFG